MTAPEQRANPQTGFTSQFHAARDGLKLHARDYGPETGHTLPVVCLPGYARTAADFHELALALAGDAKKPRRVLALDYRGRGRSDYDANWRNYDVLIELDDLCQVLAASGVHEAVFVGTSRGGLLTMALAAARPAMIRGVVMNDIGPVIDARGLLRIRGYIGKLPQPRSFAEGAEILQRMSDSQFTAFGPDDWDEVAQRTWKETSDGRLVTDYDPNLMKTLELLDLEAPLPVLWTYFLGLANVPVLAIRGANSDLLAQETLDEMTRRHADCEACVVPGQGHAPLLGNKPMITRIAKLIARAEARPPARAA
jgi:pimeloyl-ACP methyl ester carboxylesterase